MTPLQIAGMVVAIFGMGIFFISALLKTTKKVLFAQSLSHVVNIISWILTGLYSATIGEATNIIRNGFILKNKNTKLVSIILIVLSTAIGIIVNVFSTYEDSIFLNATQMYYLGYLPVVVSLIFSLIVLIPNCPIEATKGAMIFSTSCFTIYSILGGNFVMGAGNAIICLTTIISLVSIIIGNKRKAKEEIKTNEGEN